MSNADWYKMTKNNPQWYVFTNHDYNMAVCWHTAVFVYQLLTLKVLNFWIFTSYCSLKRLWSGMGEVVPARTSPTLDPQSPPTVHQLSCD